MKRAELVAIGASRGGLDALEELLSALPADLPAAVVVVQHRAAHESRLVELLRRSSQLAITEPEDKEAIRVGHVYLAPPGYHLLVQPAELALSVDEPVCFARPSIDVLFESVADAYAERAIAVMLTSSNEDGAAGAERVQRAGGRVLVQDPEEAEAPEGPKSVIARMQPDAILPLSELAPRIAECCRGSSAADARL